MIESYQEPVYGTIYYGTLQDTGSHQPNKIWTFDNAIAYEKIYTRQGSLPEYMFTITYFDGNKSYYYDIDTWNINIKAGIVNYETKSRQVIDHYETKSRQVIDHYEAKYRQIIDHYETKYRTEFKDVTKTKLDWMVIR